MTLTALDRAIAVFAPRTAAKRAAARVSLDNLARAYDGAGRSARTEGWRASNSAADVEIAAAADLLRARSRDLVRNNPIAAKAVQTLVSNIVGPGIRPRAASSDPELNRRVDELWKMWARSCDADGHTDFAGLTSLAVREMIEGGDLFALRRRLRRDQIAEGEVPLRIELKEADHLDTARSALSRGTDRNWIKDGIEYSRSGRRVAFWLFPDHPGDTTPAFTQRLESQRVSADSVAHLFERQRVQSRGVPWASPVVRALRDVDDWQHAELVRKKTEACLVGVVVGADEDQQGIAPGVKDADGNTIEQFSPGLIAYARGAKDIEFNQPSATPGVAEWHRVQLHLIAAGLRVPYELMTGDLSQVNFSSSRVGLNEFRRFVRAVQHQVVIPMFCERVWRWFCEQAALAGLLPRGDIPAKWALPPFEAVNPLQDVQTDLIEVRAGFATLSDKLAERGRDLTDHLAEHADDMRAVDEIEAVFDTDPRRVAKAGTAHSAPPGGDAGDGRGN